MTDPTSLPARLRDFIDTYRGVDGLGYTGLMFQAAERLELQAAQLAALTARLDRAVKAAKEHFGDDAVRYKLSLFQNGRARNVFPSHMDGKWFAFQRADNDAHVGLALRCAELQEEVTRQHAGPTDEEIDQSIELTWRMAWRERDQMGVAGPVSDEATEAAWWLHNERVAAICDETRPAAVADSQQSAA